MYNINVRMFHCRLDCVKYVGGRIELLPNKFLPNPSLVFDRHRE